jgi:hypothetical protein
MGVRSWWKRLRKHEDEEALRRAEARGVETPQERAASSGDIEGMVADKQAARATHEATMDDVNRLGDTE